jgi:trans-aconitate methyltransferase
MTERSQPWDPLAYDRSFAYVSTLGAPVVDLLDARPDESIIDLGCGTGDLTARIAATRARVRGVDRDAGMLVVARAKYPDLAFEVGDAYELKVDEPVDAVFSNAALHWMTRPDDVIASVYRALRPGGRFVAEAGAGANVATLIEGLRTAIAEHGLPQPALPWYFPSLAEHAKRLEAGGFEVRQMEYFHRPTPMAPEDTAADWWRMFGPSMLEQLPSDRVEAVLARVNELLAPRLVDASGVWIADYVRLRFLAIRPR